MFRNTDKPLPVTPTLVIIFLGARAKCKVVLAGHEVF